MSHARDFMRVDTRQGGRPLESTPEQIETALWVLAKNGGRTYKAVHELKTMYGFHDMNGARLGQWARGRFKARYEEICTEKAAQIEEIVAARAMMLAVEIADVEDSALRRVAAGIADSNGVEASIILRNLSQSKAVQVDKAGLLRGREAFKPAPINVNLLFERIQKAGLATVEGHAEEIPDLPAAPESPADASG